MAAALDAGVRLSRTAAGVAVLVSVATAAHSTKAAPVGVPVDVIDKRVHYEVQANDAAGLAAEMAERGPQHPTGRRAWAYTAWELRARYAVEPGASRCRLLDPAVVLEVTTTLPHWRPSRPVRTRLRASWTRMLAKAGEHEATHRQHAIDAARAAAVDIAAIREHGDCAGVERRVRDALRRANNAATRASRQFDAATDFGSRAGVRLVD